jgi:hypothetical protein
MLAGPAVYISSVSYLHDHDNDTVIVNRIEDSVGSLAHPVFLGSREPAATRWTRVGRQLTDPADDSLAISFAVDRLDLADG